MPDPEAVVHRWAFNIQGFRGFSFSKFKQLGTLGGYRKNSPAMDYALDTLPVMGSGMGRVVFAIGRGKVLKIADETYGFKQNKIELDAFHKLPKEFLPKLYDYDKNNPISWLVLEAVQVIDDTGFLRSKFNIASKILDDFSREARKTQKPFSELLAKFEVEPNKLELQLLESIYKLAKIGAGDLGRLDHWGYTAEKRLVLVDAGTWGI